MDFILEFLYIGWITFLHSVIWGGLRVDYILEFSYMGWITFLHSVIWGGLRVDYILEFLYMGRIRGGLHFCILLYGED